MYLTDGEFELMGVLWKSGVSMTVAEICDASGNLSRSKQSIYIMMTSLLDKGAVDYIYKPTTTTNARAYRPTLTLEEYLAKDLVSTTKKPDLHLNIDELIKNIWKAANELETED